ncbi:MAG: DUF4384 domain-containing protein [Ignavibacteriales bacterium]|nr:DUF4384 domain-containing protein [Ignavibacteriales bacterium]
MKTISVLSCWLILLSSLVLPVWSQTGEWARGVKGVILVTPSMTLKEARAEAIKQAQAEAVRQIVGMQVQSEQARWQSEHMVGEATKYFDLFSEAHRSTCFGRILQQQVLKEGLDAVAADGMTGQQLYSVVMDVEVMKEVGKSDPGFIVQLSLNKDIFAVGAAGSDADEVIAFIIASQDCYLTLLSLSADTVRVLLPNGYMQENKLLAGRKFEFPSVDARASGIRLRAQLPPAQKHAAEMLVAIATKQPRLFATERKDGIFNSIPTYIGAYTALTRWLVQIPPDERTEASVTFEIMGK